MSTTSTETVKCPVKLITDIPQPGKTNDTNLFDDVHAGRWGDPFSGVNATVYKEDLFIRRRPSFQLQLKTKNKK